MPCLGLKEVDRAFVTVDCKSKLFDCYPISIALTDSRCHAGPYRSSGDVDLDPQILPLFKLSSDGAVQKPFVQQ